MKQTTHFAFFLLDEFSHLAFSCALEPLRIANFVSGRPLYRWTLLSKDSVSATCSNGSVTLVHGGMEPLDRVDRLLLISGANVQKHVTPELLGFIRRERAVGTPLGAICSGAYVLACAGLLDEMQAAVHWDHHDLFAEEFPDIELVRSIFVAHEKVITASGGAAAADLMLHLVSEQHGSQLAIEVANQMVYNAVREGRAAQRVSFQSRYGMRETRLTQAIAIMEQNIEDPISTSLIAERLGISVRQLERMFRRYVNSSPKEYFTKIRLQRARNLLLQTQQSITSVALACGFQTSSHFSRVFRRKTGELPGTFRANAFDQCQ